MVLSYCFIYDDDAYVSSYLSQLEEMIGNLDRIKLEWVSFPYLSQLVGFFFSWLIVYLERYLTETADFPREFNSILNVILCTLGGENLDFLFAKIELKESFL